MKTTVFDALLIIVSLLVAMLLAEGVARLVVHPGDYLLADLAEDPIMGHRIESNASGHDEWGFRNYSRPQQSRIVAIGDSQTYGVSAILSQSWPYQLHEMTELPVYNMSLGGYGPLEYLHLLQTKAPLMGPHHIVVGLYLGNDIVDAYNAAYRREYWESWRESGRNVDEPNMLPQQVNERSHKSFSELRDYMARKSVIYGLIRVNLGPLVRFRESQSLAKKLPPDQRFIWHDPVDPNVRTIFTAKRRLQALDLSQNHVAEGLRITKQALAAMNETAQAEDRKLLVVLIPTKERVYCDYLHDDVSVQMPSDFEKLCESEERVHSEIKKKLNSEGISYVDVLPALQDKVRDHIQIYPQSSDGHPISTGYQVIAEQVLNWVD